MRKTQKNEKGAPKKRDKTLSSQGESRKSMRSSCCLPLLVTHVFWVKKDPSGFRKSPVPIVLLFAKVPQIGQKGPQFHPCSYQCRQKIKIRNPTRRSAISLCHDTHRARRAKRAAPYVCRSTAKSCAFLSDVAPSIFVGTGSVTAQKLRLFCPELRLSPARVWCGRWHHQHVEQEKSKEAY